MATHPRLASLPDSAQRNNRIRALKEMTQPLRKPMNPHHHAKNRRRIARRTRMLAVMLTARTYGGIWVIEWEQ